jgi:hypothetical protein
VLPGEQHAAFVSLIDDPKEAERLAVAILDDITLDNESRVIASRDLTTDLAKEIDEGRALFESRVAPELHRVYDDELLPWQGRARDRAVKYGGGERMDRTRLFLAIGAAVAFVVVVIWLVTRT